MLESGGPGIDPAAADGRMTCTSSHVTPEEIRAFKTSLVARRFPGIKALSDEEIATLVLSERKSRGGETRTLPQKTYPKTQFQPMSPKRADPEATQAPPKFIPCNPSQAKATTLMPPVQAFVGMYSPYDADHEDYVQYVEADGRKELSNSTFIPASASQAKGSIAVDYYLNSADEATKRAEKEATLARASQNLAAYKTATRHHTNSARSSS